MRRRRPSGGLREFPGQEKAECSRNSARANGAGAARWVFVASGVEWARMGFETKCLEETIWDRENYLLRWEKYFLEYGEFGWGWWNIWRGSKEDKNVGGSQRKSYGFGQPPRNSKMLRSGQSVPMSWVDAHGSNSPFPNQRNCPYLRARRMGSWIASERLWCPSMAPELKQFPSPQEHR